MKESNNNIEIDGVEFDSISDLNIKSFIDELESNTTKYSAFITLDKIHDTVELHYDSKIDVKHLNDIFLYVDSMAKGFKLINSGYNWSDINNILDSNVVYYPYNEVNIAIISFIANLLIFFTMFIYVVHIGNVVIEEKTSRISETLLSYITPLELLLGKLLGIFLVLLTHLSVFIIC